MSKETVSIVKNTRTNLAIFSLIYSALVLTEKQVIRRGYLGFQLPFKLDALEVIAGFIAGSILITLLSVLIKKSSRLLQMIMILSFLLGTIYINLYLFRFYYPPFSKLTIGDLDSLGANKWTHDFPYELYAGAYQKYYLATILLNPNIEDYQELARLERYGLTFKSDKGIPAQLNQSQFEDLEHERGNNYQETIANDVTFRFYDLNADEQLGLTRYGNMILFIPLEGTLD